MPNRQRFEFHMGHRKQNRFVVRLAALLCFSAGLLLDSAPAAAAGASVRGTVAAVTQSAQGHVLVSAKGGTWGNPDTCNQHAVFVIPADSQVRRELFAMVLSALLQEREIVAGFSGCMPLGGPTYPAAASITLF